jgi:peptide/nickel transport system ATP-binding protein
MTHLLEVKNLTTQFKVDGNIVQAVDDISYYIDEGEIVGLVGESGCGKSVSQLSVLQLIPTPPGRIVGGQVIFEGVDLLKFKADSEPMRAIRGGKIGMIFQEPMTSLNPVLTIGQQIIEALVLHLKMDQASARERAVELIKLVGIPDASQRIDDYPHQFSGGMRQRVMIAMALSCNPRLLIADEATTAVDVTTQAQLLEILRDLVKQFNTSLLIVTHNLGVVARCAQRIYVMYAGRIVESGTSKEIFANPRHPYTVGLLKSVPRLDEPKGRRLVPIVGMPPSLINRPPMCAFLPRCSRRVEKCQREPWPPLERVDDQHYVSCYVDTQPTVIPSEVAEALNAVKGKNLVRGNETLRSAQGDKPSEQRLRVEERATDARQLPDDTLLEVKNLKMYFPVTRGLLRRQVADVKAVDGISFKLKRGETLGLVGESGCGKTTTGRCVLRLYRPTGGRIFFEGQDISELPKSKVRPLRRKMSLIFQDPYGSLNPRQSARDIVGEPLKIHHLVHSNREYLDRVAELFRMVGLNPGLADRVPHEFSGGQRQRIGIARALACEPSLIVCDEPISALDVSIQAQIINLLDELRQGHQGLTYLFIAHDLSVVRHISDRVAVMYLGRIVEMTDCRSCYADPLHPYTRALLSAVPIPDPFVEERRERIILKGDVPSPLNPPTGCPFHPRCPIALADCRHEVPALRDVGGGHAVACIRV